MKDGWTDTLATEAQVATITEYQYFNGADEGWRLQKGWVKVVPAKDVNETAHEDDSTKWYYADGSGKIYNEVLKTINNKKYAFNSKGEMLSGVWALNVQSDGRIVGDMIEVDNADKFNKVKTLNPKNYAVYYFGSGDDGAAKTGNQTIDIDGDNYSYSFGTTGQNKYKGVSETKKTLLVMGRKIKADKDYKYQAFKADGTYVENPTTPDNAYLVNTSGTIMKNKKDVKDADGKHYETNEYGQVVRTWWKN